MSCTYNKNTDGSTKSVLSYEVVIHNAKLITTPHGRTLPSHLP